MQSWLHKSRDRQICTGTKGSRKTGSSSNLFDGLRWFQVTGGKEFPGPQRDHVFQKRRGQMSDRDHLTARCCIAWFDLNPYYWSLEFSSTEEGMRLEQMVWWCGEFSRTVETNTQITTTQGRMNIATESHTYPAMDNQWKRRAHVVRHRFPAFEIAYNFFHNVPSWQGGVWS